MVDRDQWRVECLNELLHLGPGLEEQLQHLRPQLDAPLALVRVTRTHVSRAVDAYLTGVVPGGLLERWAEFLHSSDDVEFDPTDSDLIAQFIFEASTPEVNGGQEEVVRRFRRLLDD